MASKGPRSKLDHDSRARRQKALEAPKEPPRPKTHWDHVLEEMLWLSKDIEAERKWKVSQAKKVALRASKSFLDQATRGEKKVKEEEQRLRKVALNISKDVKKFWLKIEKLVLYKHHLELEERKKKALDKQLDFLLGQTERYSTMLAENLVDIPHSLKKQNVESGIEEECVLNTVGDEVGLVDSAQCPDALSDMLDSDDEFDEASQDDMDDERTLEEDESLITVNEKREELATLQNESDPPLVELLKSCTRSPDCRITNPDSNGNISELKMERKDHANDQCNLVNGEVHSLDSSHRNDYQPTVSECECQAENGNTSSFEDQMVNKKLLPIGNSNDFSLQDKDYFPSVSADEADDEATLSEEEHLAKEETIDQIDEIELLQLESEMPLEQLLAKYKMLNSPDAQDVALESIPAHIEEAEQPEPKTSGVLENLDPKVVKQDIQENQPTLHKMDGEDIIADAAAAARSAQPTGNTFSTMKVRTKFPFLLKYPLREYQHIGLDWLVTMYEKRLNGILADEMGLGKTIMTIALLAHLASEKGIWGPHLIVVPTSVMLNWETEFLKWCPAFKILTYFGSAKERKHKRQGWLKPNYFHICITTYRLVIQDSKVFKRKKWKYLILDEAHLIKNWKSQRWQTLLNFNSKRRILLTGTPLQNDLMELWSLMHFLMPHIFQSHQEFKDWFSNPISGMVDGQEKVNKEVVDRLHIVLRPFILRRLKRDVEKQLPQKFEHVIYCRLSRRQRNLYEDFIASSETQATLASANYFGMISVIMQLRKVCNHPDLFEGRPIISSFDMLGIDMQLCSSVCTMFSPCMFSEVDLKGLNFVFTQHEFKMTSWEAEEVATIASPLPLLLNELEDSVGMPFRVGKYSGRGRFPGASIFEEVQKSLWDERLRRYKETKASISWWNSLQCQKKPVYGTDLRELVTVKHPVYDIHDQNENPLCYLNYSSILCDIVCSPVQRLQMFLDFIECFMFAIPAARSPTPSCWCSKGRSSILIQQSFMEELAKSCAPLLTPIRPAIVRRQVYFPDRRLIQFDCGKLQELAVLLRRLKSEGHRALIFTQMTKMLDILEAFINLYGYTYMRLDGSTQPEDRQTLMQRFNTNPKIFLFILSTRSGGVGINLVGADTVIFYDSDWNPAMDQQAQDRCHRIGQTREVHIYRLISESTIEENILKKANQKRILDDLVIQSGSYNTEFFKKLDPMELFSGHRALRVEYTRKGGSNDAGCSQNGISENLSNADVEAAIRDAEDEADYMALKKVEQEEAVENQEFTEEVIARLEDDELANDDDMKNEEKSSDGPSCWSDMTSIVPVATLQGGPENGENSLVLVEADEEIDMLADVRQMAAAAAAAGHASSSFETQLRPIDRYAMRFLDLWDPVIDKSAVEFQVQLQEEEWELDRIEKFKDDLEAEIDEDQEPFLYERWDADFATTAYRQHVEALAQRQLLEELEYEDDVRNNRENEGGDNIRNEVASEKKHKSTKKAKNSKSKSLKKRPLAYESVAALHDEPQRDDMHIDEKMLSPKATFYESPRHLPVKNKRKRVMPTAVDEKAPKSSLKKRKEHLGDEHIPFSKASENQLVEFGGGFVSGDGSDDLDFGHSNQNKSGSKVSITAAPVKYVMVVKQERFKKKGNFWTKDFFPSPDSWSSQEDAMVCAIVHEYGPNWSFVSDALYSMHGGGFYRGRFRHPIHCCERFRELFFKYASAVDTTNTERCSSSGSGKAFLRVNEGQIRTLLNVTSQLPDNELLLQKHFVAILSSVWRSKQRFVQQHETMSYRGANCLGRVPASDDIKLRKLTGKTNPLVLKQGSKLLMIALGDANLQYRKEPYEVEAPAEVERLDLTLELPINQIQYEEGCPSVVNVSIYGSHPAISRFEPQSSNLRSEASVKVSEGRLRAAADSCYEGEADGWVSAAFHTNDGIRRRSSSRSQSLWKHKSLSDPSRPSKSKVQRAAELTEGGPFSPASVFVFPSPRPSMDFADSPYFSQVSLAEDDHLDISSLNVPLLDTTISHELYSEFIAGLQDPGFLPIDSLDIG